ncbi:MAG: glycerol-3-phosphate acyltransferase [Dehalococcoidia bacterium]|nr:glycerol-3-phosphate acyltransferase [Dehalococcoidia bacterium]
MNFLVVILSYVIGLFPSAYIAGRLCTGIDINTVGDGNAGAANVYRNIGHVAGMAVLGTDIGKGAIAVLIDQAIVSQPVVFLCGLAVVAGHNWPIFRKFKGGRGLATTIGVVLALLPVAMAILMAAAAVPFLKKQSLILTGSILFAPLPLLAWLLGAPLQLGLYGVALACLAGIMHLVTTRNLTEAQKREAMYMR